MYNASLTSFLAVNKISLPFKSCKDLYLHSNHKVATMEGASYIELLRTGSDFEQKIHRDRLLIVSSVEEGLQKAQEGDVAFLYSIPSVNYLVGQNCTHIKIPQCFYTSTDGWAVRKDFPYTGFINH